MKLIKKIFYFIMALLMIACLGILICALNPDLSAALKARLQDWGIVPVTESISDNEVSLHTGDDMGINWDGLIVPGDNSYISPSKEAIVEPAVSDRSGFEKIQDEVIRVNDDEADRLQTLLQPGTTGEGLVFDARFYPYYAMLTAPMQKLYRQVYANAADVAEEFAPVISVNANQLKNVFEAVYNDHPELFWMETGYTATFMRNGICVAIRLKYNETTRYLDKAKGVFEAHIAEILVGTKQLTEDTEQIKYVHDALAERVDYDVNAPMNQSAYSALVGGKSVCAGYARAYQYLLQKLEIPCYYCVGFAGESHAWNITKVEDAYRNIDVTWDDMEPVSYEFYCKTDQEYADTHMRNGLSIYLPACGNNREKTGVDEYINPDPQKPLEYISDSKKEEEKKQPTERDENLKKAGVTDAEVMDTLEEYYSDCLRQMVKVGAGMQQFTNVIPEALWKEIETIYSGDGYRAGYVNEALKKLGMSNFAIQLQGQRLGGGFYRLYHNISTWNE